jgi:hypothetical protein
MSSAQTACGPLDWDGEFQKLLNERGEVNITLSTLSVLAKAIQLTISELLAI